MTTIRHPLSVKRDYWPRAAVQLWEERAAILEAEGQRRADAERNAESIVRRAWAMPGDMPPEW
jgi:hypothetical protein